MAPENPTMKIERPLWLDTATRELRAVELRDDVVALRSGPIAGSEIVEDVSPCT
jgi:hypothetical protein